MSKKSRRVLCQGVKSKVRPALPVAHTTDCRVTGIDANEEGVATASQMAGESNQAERVSFTVADANVRLPFDDNTFDTVLCINSMNHFPDRLAVFREWRRVLRHSLELSAR